MVVVTVTEVAIAVESGEIEKPRSEENVGRSGEGSG
jgi:hypothetical protein